MAFGYMHSYLVWPNDRQTPIKYSVEIIDMSHHVQTGKDEHALLQANAMGANCAAYRFCPQEMDRIVFLLNAAQFTAQLPVC